MFLFQNYAVHVDAVTEHPQGLLTGSGPQAYCTRHYASDSDSIVSIACEHGPIVGKYVMIRLSGYNGMLNLDKVYLHGTLQPRTY